MISDCDMELQKVWYPCLRQFCPMSFGNSGEQALPPMLAEILAETRPVPDEFEEVFWQNYWELMA